MDVSWGKGNWFIRTENISLGWGEPADYRLSGSVAMLCTTLILDEIHNAVRLGLVAERKVLALLEEKPARVEIVLTGREASPSIVRRADLVTELRKVKHPFDRGLRARKGIEW